jgi:hypothetical protein
MSNPISKSSIDDSSPNPLTSKHLIEDSIAQAFYTDNKLQCVLVIKRNWI